MIEIQSNSCDRLLFEVLERTVRFWSHIDTSCAQAALPNRRKTAHESIALTLKSNLEQTLETLILIYNNTGINERTKIGMLRNGLDHLAHLHTYALSAVPRPYEPVELVSYIRQAINSYQKNNNNDFSPPHVFATEYLGDQAHSRFDQVEFNSFRQEAVLRSASNDDFLPMIESMLSGEPKNQLNSVIYNNKDNAIGFISLPRIDLGNPLRWPSLIHELGHFEPTATLDSVWEIFISIESGVLCDLAITNMKQYLIDLQKPDVDVHQEIKKWLLECWCDSKAASIAGAPAFFSQMHAFLFSFPCYLTEPCIGKGYPPAWFRLRLLRDLISTRHSKKSPSNKLINKLISEEWSVIERIFPPQNNLDIRHNIYLKNLFDYFIIFLTKQFSEDKWLQQSEIDQNDLDILVTDLSEGLPIPTHARFIETNQKRASHAEILLSGWLYRNKSFCSKLLEIIKKQNFDVKIDLPRLLAVVDRSDAGLQMSIQVSEWFEILTPPDKNIRPNQDVSTSSSDLSTNQVGLLTDHEIVTLLENGKLRIIPLIGGTKSIAGTVVDVRLGHNFEIFFTNISGAVDALNPNRRNSVDSMEVDYDSLEGLEIAPGQFVLGHTLEYLKLPHDVAAEINGRSSFARLGVQVHMTAPFIETGFDGCLTLEIANSGHSTVKLYPGMRIAQLRFYKCQAIPDSPYCSRGEVKYRSMLRHNKTEQFNDWEIDAFSSELKRRNKH